LRRLDNDSKIQRVIHVAHRKIGEEGHLVCVAFVNILSGRPKVVYYDSLPDEDVGKSVLRLWNRTTQIFPSVVRSQLAFSPSKWPAPKANHSGGPQTFLAVQQLCENTEGRTDIGTSEEIRLQQIKLLHHTIQNSELELFLGKDEDFDMIPPVESSEALI
jgi:hypothetical protein